MGDDVGYVQCPGPGEPYTCGGTVVFELRGERLKGGSRFPLDVHSYVDYSSSLGTLPSPELPQQVNLLVRYPPKLG